MIDLYVSKGCPFCKKVLCFLDESNIKYELKDVSIKENFDDLMRLGGKDQVPFLYDNYFKSPMYESENIINYLKTRY